MKNFSLLQAFCLCILLSLAVACNNNYASHCANGVMDGNETGIDCGGDCPNCPSNGTANPNVFGNWYKIYSCTETFTNGNGLLLFRVNTNPACRANILNQVVSNVNGIVTYKTEGMVGACAYPTSSFFSYDNVIHYIHKLTPDTFVYANSCFLKGSNPYVGENPYVKIRFVILENECGDSSLKYMNNGHFFYSIGQQYFEIIKQNNANQADFMVSIEKNNYFWDYSNPPSIGIGGMLSWYQNAFPQDKHITYKLQFWDKNDNLMYETIPYRKIMYGPNYSSNPFARVDINLSWGM